MLWFDVMYALITGGSGSGKSEYAEKLLEGCQNKIYLATMRPFGREARERIERHRQQRLGRGFSTLERYNDVASLTETELPKGSSVLLECMGNLVANELFEVGEDGLSGRMEAALELLQIRCENLVVVTNDVFCGGERHSPEVAAYARLLAEANRMAASRCDLVIEVVCSIPLTLKGASL